MRKEGIGKRIGSLIGGFLGGTVDLVADNSVKVVKKGATALNRKVVAPISQSIGEFRHESQIMTDAMEASNAVEYTKHGKVFRDEGIKSLSRVMGKHNMRLNYSDLEILQGLPQAEREAALREIFSQPREE